MKNALASAGEEAEDARNEASVAKLTAEKVRRDNQLLLSGCGA